MQKAAKFVFRLGVCMLGPMQANAFHKITIRGFGPPVIKTFEMNAWGQRIQMPGHHFFSAKQNCAETEGRDNGAANPNNG